MFPATQGVMWFIISSLTRQEVYRPYLVNSKRPWWQAKAKKYSLFNQMNAHLQEIPSFPEVSANSLKEMLPKCIKT